MVYEDREDDLMLDDAQLYADDPYGEQLADTFHEQLPKPGEDLDADEMLKEQTTASGIDTPIMTGGIVTPPSTSAANVEEGFGESINPDLNPHLEDQLSDQELSDEAEREYRENE